MPYTIIKDEENKWGIWEMSDDLKILKENHGNYDSQDEALQKFMEVQNFTVANTQPVTPVQETLQNDNLPEPKITIREMDSNGRTKVEIVAESYFAGVYPNIPLPSDVNVESIPESERVFVTLPIGRFNSESLNGHTYSETAMRKMVDQINKNRPESNWGHIKDEDFGYRYSEPPVRWLAAAVDANGTVWGKCRALTPESQRYYRNAKIDNARVGTSLFAWAETDGTKVIDMDLISIDLADPARVGVPMTAAKPMLASEMTEHVEENEAEEKENKIQEEMNTEENLMEKVMELQVRQALGVAEDADILEGVKEFASKNEQLTKSVTELTEAKTGLEARVQELTTEREALITESVDNMVDAKISIASVRELVKSILKGRKMESYTAAKEAVEDVLKLEYVQTALKTTVQESMGQRQTRPANQNNEGKGSMAAYFNVPAKQENE